MTMDIVLQDGDKLSGKKRQRKFCTYQRSIIHIISI